MTFDPSIEDLFAVKIDEGINRHMENGFVKLYACHSLLGGSGSSKIVLTRCMGIISTCVQNILKDIQRP